MWNRGHICAHTAKIMWPSAAQTTTFVDHGSHTVFSYSKVITVKYRIIIQNVWWMMFSNQSTLNPLHAWCMWWMCVGVCVFVCVCVCVCVLRLFCLEMSNGQVLIYMADRSMELCKHVIHIACLDVVHPNWVNLLCQSQVRRKTPANVGWEGIEGWAFCCLVSPFLRKLKFYPEEPFRESTQ